MADEMEQRLMALINNSTERVLDRIGTVDQRLTTVETRIDVLRGLVSALPASWRERLSRRCCPG